MARPKHYRRETVLEKAMQVFWSQGYQATSLTDLVAATGINKKSLYNEFGDKEGLFRAALELYSSQREDRARAVLDREPYGAVNLREFFGMFGQNLSRRGCLFTLSLNERESVSDGAIERILCTFGQLEELFARNLRAALPAAEPAEIAEKARYLLVLLPGLTTMGRVETEPGRLQKVAELALSCVLPATP